MHRNIQPFKLTFSFSFPSSSFVSQSPPPTFNSGKCDCSKKEVKIKSNYFFYFSYFFSSFGFYFDFVFLLFQRGLHFFFFYHGHTSHVLARERSLYIDWFSLQAFGRFPQCLNLVLLIVPLFARLPFDGAQVAEKLRPPHSASENSTEFAYSIESQAVF